MIEVRQNLRKVAAGAACLAEGEEAVIAVESRDHAKNNGVSPKYQMSRGNKCSLVIFICLLFFGVFSTYAQESKLRIAVIDFRCNCDNSDGMRQAKDITILLTTELVNTNKFRVVERSRIDQLIKEQKFQSTQDISAQAVELGKLLGVHKIIVGEVSRRYSIFADKGDKTSVRLIDVESGDIEAAIIVNNYYYIRHRGEQKEQFRSNEEIVEEIIRKLLK